MICITHWLIQSHEHAQTEDPLTLCPQTGRWEESESASPKHWKVKTIFLETKGTWSSKKCHAALFEVLYVRVTQIVPSNRTLSEAMVVDID